MKVFSESIGDNDVVESITVRTTGGKELIFSREESGYSVTQSGRELFRLKGEDGTYKPERVEGMVYAQGAWECYEACMNECGGNLGCAKACAEKCGIY